MLCSVGGIPLIFLGEELGLFNDPSYEADPEKSEDSRWIHRPTMDWALLEALEQTDNPRARLFEHLHRLFELRGALPALVGNQMRLLPSENDHVLDFLRWHDGSLLVVIANFSERSQRLNLAALRAEGLSHFMKDRISGKVITTRGEIELEPYEILWLEED